MRFAWFGVTDRWVLVTGGSRGIGKEIALECSRRGYNVVLTYNSGKEEAENARQSIVSLGRKCEVFQMDAADRQSYRRFITKYLSSGIRVDGIVNNAGIYRGETLADATDEIWDEVIAVNLTTPFRIIRDLRSNVNEGGSIVNISSVYGIRSDPWGYAYQASKSGLIHLTRALAKEFAPKIRVNCVAPGFIRTDMNSDGWTDEKFKSHVIKNTPLKRWGEAGDIAPVVCFLLSGDSGFITGATISVDGGIGL